MSDQSPPVWFALAARALTAARDDDMDRAAQAVNAIGVRYGNNEMPWVMLAWIDTMTLACDLKPKQGQPFNLRWRHENGGPATDADDTPAPARWAGRVIAARLADDWDQFSALVDSCASDEEWQSNVSGVLDVCAAMLRRHAGGESS